MSRPETSARISAFGRRGLWLVCWLATAVALARPAHAADADGATTPTYQTLWTHGDYREALASLEADLAAIPGQVPHAMAADHARLLESVGRVDEATRIWQDLLARYGQPADAVALALDARERGRDDLYRQALQMAVVQAQRTLQREDDVRTVVAMARLVELIGENPQRILVNYLVPWMQRAPDSAEVRIAAGDLAYRRYNYALAAGHYRDALELEPANQEALAGLAECYWKSGDDRLDGTLARLLAINPNAPRAMAIRTRGLLDLAKPEEALKLIDARMKVNPNDARFNAYKYAAYFLEGDRAAMATAEKAALEWNPKGGTFFATAGRVIARQYRFAEAAALLRRGLKADPDNTEVQSELAINLLRMGRQREGRELLEAAFKADPYNVVDYNMLEVLDALDGFTTLRRGPFVVQMPKADADVMGEAVLATLAEAAKRYQAKYATRISSPVLVQLFDDHDEFMVRSVGLPGATGELGICFGDLITMDSPKARAPGTLNWRAVLWHEFLHVITLQKTGNRIPRWLSEGISVYEQADGDPAWAEPLDLRFKPLLAPELAAGKWPTVGDLELYFTQPKSQMHLVLGYFLAGEFVKEYVAANGIEALNGALDRINRGAPTAAALAEAAGKSGDALDAQFKAHLEKRLALLANLPAPPKAQAPERRAGGGDPAPRQAADPSDWMKLDSPFTDALRAGAAAAEKKEWDTAAEAFKKADALFPEYNGQDAPLRQLAGVYKQAGEADKQAEALRRLVGRDSTGFDACRALAELARGRGDWKTVAEAARRGFEIEPFDVANLTDLHEARVALGDRSGALETAAQLAALDTAHAVDWRIERARLLLEDGRKPEARTATLGVLEEYPWDWGAQRLLLALDGDGATSRPAAREVSDAR